MEIRGAGGRAGSEALRVISTARCFGIPPTVARVCLFGGGTCAGRGVTDRFGATDARCAGTARDERDDDGGGLAASPRGGFSVFRALASTAAISCRVGRLRGGIDGFFATAAVAATEELRGTKTAAMSRPRISSVTR